MRLPPRRATSALVALAIALAGVGCGSGGELNASSAAETERTEGRSERGQAPRANLIDGCVDGYREGVDYFPDRVAADHAQGWEVRYEDNYKVVTTTVTAASAHSTAQDRVIDSTYVLVQCGTPAPDLRGELADAHVIEVPVRTVVDGGSVLYAALEKLGVPEALVGHAEPFFGDTEAPYLPNVAQRIEQGEVAEIGYEVNLEALAEADPDIYTNYAGDDAMFAQIEQLGIPVVMYFPYSEPPLGAAEQVKFLSLFLNLEQRANEVFEPIAQRYTELQQQVEPHAAGRDAPQVLIGVVGDGGDVTTRQNQRFEPQLVRAAGGQPVPDLDGGGQATISIERFLEEGASADFWMDLTFFPSHQTTQDYIAADSRLETLRPLRDGATFHRIGRRGMDYFLNGAIEVDRTLADIASILHPELLPDHEREFFTLIPAG